MSDFTPEWLAKMERLIDTGGLATADQRELCMALREAWAERDEYQKHLHCNMCAETHAQRDEYKRKYETWQSDLLGEMQGKLAAAQKVIEAAREHHRHCITDSRYSVEVRAALAAALADWDREASNG